MTASMLQPSLTSSFDADLRTKGTSRSPAALAFGEGELAAGFATILQANTLEADTTLPLPSANTIKGETLEQDGNILPPETAARSQSAAAFDPALPAQPDPLRIASLSETQRTAAAEPARAASPAIAVDPSDHSEPTVPTESDALHEPLRRASIPGLEHPVASGNAPEVTRKALAAPHTQTPAEAIAQQETGAHKASPRADAEPVSAAALPASKIERRGSAAKSAPIPVQLPAPDDATRTATAGASAKRALEASQAGGIPSRGSQPSKVTLGRDTGEKWTQGALPRTLVEPDTGSPSSPGSLSVTPATPNPSTSPIQSGPTNAGPVASTVVSPFANPTPAPAQNPAASQSAPNAPVSSTIDQFVEQIAEAREAGRAVRPELTVRNSDFGSVALRIDASTSDWRATLSARDPGFVPAVQAALAERAVAATSESSLNQQNASQRGQDPHAQSGSQSSSSFGAPPHGNESRYGSSPGSAKGSAQPYSGEEGSGGSETSATGYSDLATASSRDAADGARFA